jgi:AraC family transcriptional regulator, regulatory protein of adaptative response / methylated-DNA-[protein]-cysteine methyltransferase
MNAATRRQTIDQACRALRAQPPPSLAALAKDAGVSPSHFQKLFKEAVGVSPKNYAMALRQQRLGRQLRQAPSVTAAIYDAGYEASSGAYRDSKALGMTPKTIHAGGVQEQIQYACAKSQLGPVMVATTQRGICMVEFGSERTLRAELVRRFPQAQISAASAAESSWLAAVIAAIDTPSADFGLALDIRGTAFQIKVWNALTKLRVGETLSYSALAKRIGAPSSTRAVARACATNGIAVLVPCHRVISATGALTGYKWGIERKRKLLALEHTKQGR